MPTKNPRINLVLEKPLYETIEKLADNNDLSLSSQVKDLIIEAVETHEDFKLSKVAEKRGKYFSKKRALSHKKFWGKVKKIHVLIMSGRAK